MNKHAERILVVDDDTVILTLCRRSLEHAGYAADTVNTAETVLDILSQQRFDLVLLDIQMPVIDGLTLLEQIRNHNLDVPIVIITGAATIEHTARAMRAGAQGLLLKPFTPDKLCSTVSDVIQKRREIRTYDRVRALRPLVRVSERLLSELDLPRLYDLIIETVRVELRADRASIMLCEPDSDTLRIVAGSGLPDTVQMGQLVPRNKSLAGWVATHCQPVFVERQSAIISPGIDLRHLLVEEEVIASLSAPLVAGDCVLGVLNAAKTTTGSSFSEADRELLVMLASQAVVAIENARLYNDVTHSEARYRALLQHANDAVLLLDEHGEYILDANPAAEYLTGYAHSEIMLLSRSHLFPQLGVRETYADGAGADQEGDAFAIDAPSELETSLRPRSGHTIPVSVSISRIPYDGQHMLLMIARDISERQRVAQQLFQTEKLAAVGRISASLAHEINNPLQAIRSSLHLVLNHALDDEKRQRYLTMTHDEVERLISLVGRVLDFYRPSREGMRPVHLHDLLEAVLMLVANELEKNRVRVTREWAADLPEVPVISNHMKQVYLNLIFNAIEAMPDGGELTIRTYLTGESDGQYDANFILAAIGSAGHRVRGPSAIVEFSDTGAGIPSQDLSRVFEPFYTTRTTGTGLGLAICYSIVEQHHGELSVSSYVGKGSTFRIRLPFVS